jgi:hypothetical protein
VPAEHRVEHPVQHGELVRSGRQRRPRTPTELRERRGPGNDDRAGEPLAPVRPDRQPSRAQPGAEASYEIS